MKNKKNKQHYNTRIPTHNHGNNTQKPPQQTSNPAAATRATKQAIATPIVRRCPPKQCLHGGYKVHGRHQCRTEKIYTWFFNQDKTPTRKTTSKTSSLLPSPRSRGLIAQAHLATPPLMCHHIGCR